MFIEFPPRNCPGTPGWSSGLDARPWKSISLCPLWLDDVAVSRRGRWGLNPLVRRVSHPPPSCLFNPLCFGDAEVMERSHVLCTGSRSSVVYFALVEDNQIRGAFCASQIRHCVFRGNILEFISLIRSFNYQVPCSGKEWLSKLSVQRPFLLGAP